MSSIHFCEREMTDAEFARMNAGFDEHSLQHGNPVETAERYGFVVMDGETFIGCSSGLAYRGDGVYNNWFYLSDLFIEQPYRGQGLGAAILGKLEARVAGLGIRYIWTWTAGYEAPGFYKQQGYTVFCELENWYFSGHSRVGLRKSLADRPVPPLPREFAGCC
jgi:GNAT superfamily N-acetyltransferase